MIRRFFVLWLLAIIVIGASAFVRPVKSASSDPCAQDHAAWLNQVLENGDHKTGHDAMGPPASFQDGRRTTNVQDGGRTIRITRNICQSGLSIFQNCRRVSADTWGPQSGRNRQSLEALCAIQHCELGARQAAESS